MDKFTETLLYLDSKKLTSSQLVSILILIKDKLEINTICELARINKLNNEKPSTPRGIMVSPDYTIINIGKQNFGIKGVVKDKLPF